MKRFTDWMVVADAVGASARASSPHDAARRSPGTTPPTARSRGRSPDRRSRAGSRRRDRRPGCWSSRDRCRLSVPRRPQLLVDVPQQRADVVQLRENRLGLRQRRRAPLPVASLRSKIAASRASQASRSPRSSSRIAAIAPSRRRPLPAARAARSSSSCSCTSKTRAASAGGTRSLSRPSDSPCSSSQ